MFLSELFALAALDSGRDNGLIRWVVVVPSIAAAVEILFRIVTPVALEIGLFSAERRGPTGDRKADVAHAVRNARVALAVLCFVPFILLKFVF